MKLYKIVANLQDGVLPDIKIVAGDNGVEIQLEMYSMPDSKTPIDLETYYADLIIIKPDNTFTITTFDNDTVEIPEQAGAVSGRGFYQIKIYTSGDHKIYTGQGNFIVDDYILNDRILESISEVNGLVFPDDFLTSADLSNYATKDYVVTQVDSLIEDDFTSYIQTWSSAKIQSELNNVKHSYSTTEQIVGKWIDNSNIYEKTYHITIDDNNNHVLDAELTNSVIRLVGDTSINIYAPGYNTDYNGIGPSTGARIFVNPSGICCSLENYQPGFGTCDIYATVQYIRRS